MADPAEGVDVRHDLPEFITTQIPRWSVLPEISRARRRLVLGVCCVGLFMAGTDNTIVNVALPSIRAQIHASVSGLQWTVTAYTLVLASLMIVAGAAGDRFGRRTMFQVGLALFTLGSWLCSLAPSLGWLIAFRVIQAVGGSMLNPVAASIISRTYTDAGERARALGIWGGMIGWSMALGPVLGGLLIGAAGWRSIFWVNIPVGLAAIALTAICVPESRAPRPRRPDPAGQFMVVVMLGSLTYAIIEGPADGWRSPKTAGLFAVALVALLGAAGYESRRREPFIDPRFFRSVPFSGAVLTAICSFALQGGFLFLSTLYLQDVRGLSPLGAGLRLLPAAAGMAVCGPLGGWMIARRGAKGPLLIAGVTLTLGSAALSGITGVSSDRLLALIYVLFGVGLGMANSSITVTALSGMPKAQAGVAGGISSAARQVGQSLGVAIVGAMLTVSLRGQPLQAGFVRASRPGWWLLAGCGYLILVLGFVATSGWAVTSAARTAARLGSDSPPGGPVPLRSQGVPVPPRFRDVPVPPRSQGVPVPPRSRGGPAPRRRPRPAPPRSAGGQVPRARRGTTGP